MKCFVLLLVIIAIISSNCTNMEKVKENGNSFYSINFSAMIKDKRSMSLSSISESIDYIELETNKLSVLSNIHDVKFTKEYIFIKHGDKLLAQFDRKGNFLRNIGVRGKGPGEYLGIREFSLDEKNYFIYIQANWTKQILKYSFGGKYLKTFFLNKDDIEIVWSRDSMFMCFSEPSIGNEKYVFKEINNLGDTIQGVKNYCLWNEKKISNSMYRFHGRNIFYRINNKLHFKGEFNDTVYTLDNNNKITPKFYVDLKSHHLPSELRLERGYEPRGIPSEYYWDCLRETDRYIFIHYATFTPNETETKLLDDGYIMYDKKNKDGSALLVNNGEYGFINDLDGGMNFIPKYSNDSLAFQIIETTELKNYMSTNKFHEQDHKKSQLYENLKVRISKLNENDNPVIMVVKLKKNSHLD